MPPFNNKSNMKDKIIKKFLKLTIFFLKREKISNINRNKTKLPILLRKTLNLNHHQKYKQERVKKLKSRAFGWLITGVSLMTCMWSLNRLITLLTTFTII